MITCPKCGARHDRGPVNGVDGYRCLACGESFHGDDSRIAALVIELGSGAPVEVSPALGKYPGSWDFAIRRGGELVRIEKHLTYCGQHARHSCDAKCSKAWGGNGRPKVQLDPSNPDDFFYYADHELGVAPADPGTYEGGHAKPTEVTGPESINKWCVRECERGAFTKPGRPFDDAELPDFTQRLYNIPTSRGKVPS